MKLRPYDAERDLAAVLRIHDEAGWPATTDEHREATRLWHACDRSLVAEVNGRAESFASNVDGFMHYLDEVLPLCVVGGVATSHLARRQGLATRVTAEAIAADVVEKGAAVAVLGVFDQGFYDRLGFGSGGYDHLVSFDPADLRVEPPRRVPLRLTLEDAERMHRGRLAAARPHGGITLTASDYTRGDMLVTAGGFGLGFADDCGEITHHFWSRRDDRGAGPYWIRWLAFRDREQFLELMGLLKSLGEQVHLVRFVERPDMQVHDLLERPWRRRAVSVGSKFETVVQGIPWWQVRICDLEACLAATRLPAAESVRFNLALTDPIAERLTEATAQRWSGVGGDYVVTLGPESGAVRSAPDAALPTLRTSVNTFSRMWLGVRPVAGLALTAADLDAPTDLLRRLGRVLRLPPPGIDWAV